jgi:hypothetical protein
MLLFFPSAHRGQRRYHVKTCKVAIEFHAGQQAGHGFRCTAFHENHKRVQTAFTECQPNLTTNVEKGRIQVAIYACKL